MWITTRNAFNGYIDCRARHPSHGCSTDGATFLAQAHKQCVNDSSQKRRSQPQTTSSYLPLLILKQPQQMLFRLLLLPIIPRSNHLLLSKIKSQPKPQPHPLLIQLKDYLQPSPLPWEILPPVMMPDSSAISLWRKLQPSIHTYIHTDRQLLSTNILKADRWNLVIEIWQIKRKALHYIHKRIK